MWCLPLAPHRPTSELRPQNGAAPRASSRRSVAPPATAHLKSRLYTDGQDMGRRAASPQGSTPGFCRPLSSSLFVTPKTVEYHLRNAYRKLDIQTRQELASALNE